LDELRLEEQLKEKAQGWKFD